MLSNPNQRIIGSIVLGLALVAGAYTISNFGEPRMNMPAAAITATAPLRVPIATTDTDNNGIEDWRDELIPPQASFIADTSTSSEEYVLPSTLTGQLSINLVGNYLQSKVYGPFSTSRDSLIETTVTDLVNQTEQKLFNTRDIVRFDSRETADVKNYANAVALILLNNSIDTSDTEIDVLYDIVVNGDDSRLEELVNISIMYRNIVQDLRELPVPSLFLKQHLDLLNSYNALYFDVEAMSQAINDPTLTFMRFKRYLDDVEALRISLQNLYLSFAPYQNIFTSSDSALFFNNFNPNAISP